MVAQDPYALVYDPGLRRQVLKVGRKYFGLVRREIEARLRHGPEVETRNRKPLRRLSSIGATWELRFGPENRFRVFYRTDRVRREVHVLAVGVKIRDRLFVGGEEFDL